MTNRFFSWKFYWVHKIPMPCYGPKQTNPVNLYPVSSFKLWNTGKDKSGFLVFPVLIYVCLYNLITCVGSPTCNRSQHTDYFHHKDPTCCPSVHPNSKPWHPLVCSPISRNFVPSKRLCKYNTICKLLKFSPPLPACHWIIHPCCCVSG